MFTTIRLALLLLFALSSCVRPLCASECSTPISRAQFVRQAYDANLQFIRKGVPAIAVDSFFRRAIVNTLHKCSCPLTEISVLCTRLEFDANNVVRRLQAVVTKGFHEDQQVGRVHYFPLYHEQHPLQPLEPAVSDVVDHHAGRLQQFLEPLNSTDVALVEWSDRIFPSEDHLFTANSTIMSNACTAYGQHHTPNASSHVFANQSVAFALGIVQVIRYAGGDVHAATQLLSEHIQYVYNAAICLRKSDSDLPIPTVALHHLLERAKDLLSTALEDLHNNPGHFVQFYQYHLPAPTELENIDYISAPPLRMFRALVHQLASISSGGLALIYFDLETSHGYGITVRLTEDLLSCTNPYHYLAV